MDETTVASILDREAPHLDLAWFSTFDLYWEYVRPLESCFSGRYEGDLIAEVEAWRSNHVERVRP